MVKTVIRRIQDQHFHLVPRGYAGSDTASKRPPVNDDMLFRIAVGQPFVDGLGVVVQFEFRPFALALAKTAVIHHKKIVAVTDEVLGEFAPSLYAPGIAF